MRLVLLALTSALLIGCADDKPDMSTMKSPQAGTSIPTHPAGQKPIKPTFRIVPGGEGNGVILSK